jgi:hypothetical protein
MSVFGLLSGFRAADLIDSKIGVALEQPLLEGSGEVPFALLPALNRAL